MHRGCNQIFATPFELPSGIYLFTHAVGPLTRAGRQAATGFFDAWGTEYSVVREPIGHGEAH